MRIYEFLLYLLDKMYYYFKFIHEKRKNLEKYKYDKNKKLISLSPTNDAEFIDDYEDYLYNALSEEDKYGNKRNKNIAITGGYASGKSSIIKTFLYQSNLHSKTVYVSLGSYTENEEEVNWNENEEEVNWNEIEKSILQQIIYSSNKNDLPLSNIKRINIKEKINIKKFICNLFFSIFISLSLFIIYVLLKPSNILFSEEYIVAYTIIFILIGLIIYLGFSFISINKAKLSIGDLNLELENKKIENTAECLLNRQIDELIYFFSKADKIIVVFEDLDRIKDCKKIFSKLKEINEIINTAIDKDIQFIYAVNDTLFESTEHRTKFFDILIPIIPYGSYSNTIDIFRKNLNDSDIDELWIYEISSYVENPRDIFDTINEYRIIKENMNNKHNKMQYFYLAAYKVLYSRRFDLLYKNKGIISYYLSGDFISDVKKKYEHQIKSDIDKRINVLNKQHNDKIKPIVDKFLYSLMRNDEDYESIKFYDNEKMLTTYEELKNDCEKIYNLKDKNIKASSEYSEEIPESNLFENKEEFFKKIDRSQLDKEIRELENNKIIPSNYEEISNNFKENCIKEGLTRDNKYYCNENLEFNKINDFEEILIRNDVFNYLTFDVISKKHDYSITNNDLNIIDNMYKKINLDFDTIINNPNLVLKRLKPDNFLYNSYCNFDLFKTILSSNNKDQYLKVFCSYLSERKLIFLVEYEIRYKGLFSNISKYYSDIWGSILFFNLDDMYMYNYLIYTLKYNKEKIFPEHFKNCLVIYDNILNYLEIYFDEIIINLNKLDIKFSNEIVYNTDNIRILEYIYKTNKFEPSLEVYEKLSIVNDFKFNRNSLIDTFIANEENSYLKNNIDLLVNEAIKLNIKQNNKEENIIKFIDNDFCDNTTKYNLLNLENNDIKDITDIDNKHYDELINIDKIGKNWKNIYAIQQVNKSLTNEQVKYVLNNLEELKKDKTEFSNYDGLCYSLCSHDELEINDYDKLAKLTSERNRIFSNVLNVSSAKLDLLINYHLLKLKNQEDIRVLLDNEEINNKTLLIEDNYSKIKPISDFFKTSEELLMLLDSHIIIEDKINYCLNYIDKGLINNDVSNKIFDKIITTDSTIINNVTYVTSTLLALNKPEEDKIKVFLKHCHNENISYAQALQNIGGKFAEILYKKNNLYIKMSDINKELLDFLVEIKLIKDYKIQNKFQKNWLITYFKKNT